MRRSCRPGLVCGFFICYTVTMKKIIIKGPGMDEKQLNIEDGSSMAEIAAGLTFPYRILLARLNGIDTPLTEVPGDGDNIEFLDMRTHSANLAYQRGVSMLFLTAVQDVSEAKDLFGTRAVIENSLNKGFFTKITSESGAPQKTVETILKGVTAEDVAEIEERMHELVRADLPIESEYVTKEEGVRLWEKYGYPEKAELLANVNDPNYVAQFNRIDVPVEGGVRPYRNFFFGPLVPSTGYIEYFELIKYRDGMLLRFPYYNKPDIIPDFIDDAKMYEAFSEEHNWLDLLHTPYLSDMNRVIANGGSKEMILLSEALHQKKIVEIADEITNLGKRIILIAGPSSSGKTTFARRLCVQLRVNGQQPLYLGTDDYFLDRVDTPIDENGEKNYENMDALDVNLFSRNMNDLLAGKEVDIPEFDFLEGVKKYGGRITKIGPEQPIVIEGIHALNGKLTEQIDDKEKFKIYISPLTQLNIDMNNRLPTTDARMLRRMVRDYKYRGHEPAITIREWPKVRAGEDRNIFPYNREADFMFNSTLAYETCLLKKYAEPLLKKIDRDQPEYSEAQRLLGFFKFFSEIEDENDVPNNSILREFIGGSVFV